MRKFTKLLSAIIFALSVHLSASAQTIITVMGVGIEGYTGDGASPLNAQVHWPTGVALSKKGVVYVADALNNVVRKIDSGFIRTVAGTGFESGTGFGGFSGDGAAATAARLHFPTGVAIDTIGNLYIADQKNNRIRKIDTNGIITTICGNGVAAYAGDGGSAASAQLSAPSRVAVDTFMNVYIADAGNNAIRKIDGVTGNISTIAGTGVAGYNGDAIPANTSQLNGPMDVAVNDSGYVFIADTYNNRIRKIDRFGAIYTLTGNGVPGFAGDSGQASAAIIYYPSGIAADDSGRVYFSQLGDSRLRKINLNDTIVSLAGTDSIGYNGDNIPAIGARLWFPQGIALKHNGDVYVADEGNNRVRLITSTQLAVNGVNAAREKLSIYPNPNDGIFTVRITSDFPEPAHLVVCNITGEKFVDKDMLTSHPETINANFPPGIYFVNAVTSHGVMSGKLLIR